jgi:hypothetical protein
MTREAEVEAWLRGRKRTIHSQLLIQFLAVLAIATPLPITALVFWAAFSLDLPFVIQSIVALWAITAIVYVGMSIYIRIKQRNP